MPSPASNTPLPSPGGLYVQPSAGNSSSFLLLTSEHTPLLSSPNSPAPAPHTRLAPPRFRFVLQLACIVDLAVVLGTTVQLGVSKLPSSAIALNALRPVVVFAVVSSEGVRGMGTVVIGQVLVSLLVLLYRFNDLVQRSSPSSPPSHPTHPSPSPPSVSSFPLHVPSLKHLLNPITRWYLLCFAFSLLHYLLFALFIGVRRRRNPFSGRMRRSGNWGEQVWRGSEEEVSGGTGETWRRQQRGRTASRGSRAYSASGSLTPSNQEEDEEEHIEEMERDGENDEDEVEELLDNDGAASSSEDDEDDLVDIPRPGTLRHRPSRASLLGSARSPPSPTTGGVDGNRPGLRASRGFGSMRSLAGI